MSRGFCHPRRLKLVGGLWVALQIGLSGCSSEAPWDQALVCAGTETVSTSTRNAQGATAIQNGQPYAIRLQVRVREGRLHLKSLVAERWTTNDGLEHYRADTPGGWLVGQLDPGQGQLQVISERSLDVAGDVQTVRTVGRYACVPSNGPLLTSRT